MRQTLKNGAVGEQLAIEYLEKKAYHILQRNYRFEHGEIDIVADDHGVLVFVEVKARSSREYGEPEEAVTESKRRKIRHTADGYLFENGIDDRICRFDVIGIEFGQQRPVIRHLEDAF
ncbi:MAG TPA: YraN family protein [Bacteroidota bacterium]|nr:YraN family protein [Bacteroidota bacterium]